MPIIQILNTGTEPVSTTIGRILPGASNVVNIQYDQVPIPINLYNELEALRLKRYIEYAIIEDPAVRDDIELAPYYDQFKTSLNKLGEPTNGSYQDGFFTNWTADTIIPNAMVDVSNTILNIVPAKAGQLTGTTPVLSGVPQYTAKIPSGLSSYWNPLVPGTIINTLIVGNTYKIESPDSTTKFSAGKAADPTTAGILTYVLNGVDGPTYDIGVHGPGTLAPITVSSLSAYNTFWLKANVYVDIVQMSEGKRAHALKHSEAGQTNDLTTYYDDVNTSPAFSSPLSIIDNTPAYRWLSGIRAYGIGSTFDAGYTAGAGIFRKAYHPTAVGNISGIGHTTSNDNPVSVPAVNDPFVVSRILTLNAPNQSTLTPSLTATIRKPDGTSALSSVNLSMPVNTYSIVSTNKTESFFDEAKRIVLNSGTYSGDSTAFDSTVSLVNGNAQQRHNGELQYPDTIDYPGFTGDQEYQRFIYKLAASNGALTLNNTLFTDIDPYGTGNLNVLIHLTTSGKWYDLGQPIGSNNGDGSGSSRSNSRGAKNQTLSIASTLAWSVGTDSTALNHDEYRLVIIFKNGVHSITGLSEA